MNIAKVTRKGFMGVSAEYLVSKHQNVVGLKCCLKPADLFAG
jgi:hypothetical protein